MLEELIVEEGEMAELKRLQEKYKNETNRSLPRTEGKIGKF